MPASAGPSAPTPAEIWSAGDYADVCDRMIPELGARLVELTGVGAGEAVLDVACGTGNVALPGAGAGAAVSALDITPALLEVGAARAAAADLLVAWVQGDAETMPFEDAAFDRVLSCVGAQFCGDQEKTASELARVCRRGGRLGLIAWTSTGLIGQVLGAVGRAGGGATPGGPSPLDWGREERLEELFAGRSGSIVATREQVEMPAPSAAAWVDYMATAYGPLLSVRERLEPAGAWSPLRRELIEVAIAHDAGAAAGFRGHAEYLAAVIEW
jgi:SAM-dependent methyltransferase